MTAAALRHAWTAADNRRMRAQLTDAREDLALLTLRLHLAPWTVQVDPSPRPGLRSRAERHGPVIPAPRQPGEP